MQKNLTGLFGKLPAHGDFIFRDLPPSFITVWDEWLQGFIGAAREQLGESWLDIYLTSPIWRFAFSEGVIDGNAWAGIVLPSVDRVGRYFPFSIATKLPAQANPVEFLCGRSPWFQSIEELALGALDGRLTLDTLVEELNDANPIRKEIYQRGATLQGASRTLIKLPNAEQSVGSVLPFMVDALLRGSLQSYSAWSTKGSSCIDPCLFVCAGLPPLNAAAAMFDGAWAERGWQEPFPLKQFHHHHATPTHD